MASTSAAGPSVEPTGKPVPRSNAKAEQSSAKAPKARTQALTYDVRPSTCCDKVSPSTCLHTFFFSSQQEAMLPGFSCAFKAGAVADLAGTGPLINIAGSLVASASRWDFVCLRYSATAAAGGKTACGSTGPPHKLLVGWGLGGPPGAAGTTCRERAGAWHSVFQGCLPSSPKSSHSLTCFAHAFWSSSGVKARSGARTSLNAAIVEFKKRIGAGGPLAFGAAGTIAFSARPPPVTAVNDWNGQRWCRCW